MQGVPLLSDDGVTVTGMASFDDRAWVRLVERFHRYPYDLVASTTPGAAMDDIFEGWARVVAHAPELSAMDASQLLSHSPAGRSGRMLSGQGRHFYVFRHPTMVAAVSLDPECRYIKSTGTVGTRRWLTSTLQARTQQVEHALRHTALVAESLLGLADQMVALVTSNDTEVQARATMWKGHAHRLVPAGLKEVADPETRGSYQVLAGLGAYDH